MILTQNKDLHGSLQDLSGTFAGLMDLYERNYIGVRRLIPTMPPAGTSLQSRVPGGLPLHVSILERFPYTTELALTYYFFRDGHCCVAEPDLRIKVYNDARQAEVVAAHLRRWPEFDGHQAFSPEIKGTQLRVRWRVNRFLYKWLNYCLYQGHRFDQACSQDADFTRMPSFPNR